MSDPFLLGIDQGTTGTRAVVMNLAGGVECSAYRKHRQIMPDLGDGIHGVEHDPVEIWENSVAVVREVIPGFRIAGIGLSNQGETVMLWHRETGEPLHNAIVWQDRRTQDWMEELQTDPELSHSVSEKTGLHLDAYFSASKIRWLLDHIPGTSALLKEGKLC